MWPTVIFSWWWIGRTVWPPLGALPRKRKHRRFAVSFRKVYVYFHLNTFRREEQKDQEISKTLQAIKEVIDEKEKRARNVTSNIPKSGRSHERARAADSAGFRFFMLRIKTCMHDSHQHYVHYILTFCPHIIVYYCLNDPASHQHHR